MPHIILPQQRGKDSIAEMAPFIPENTLGSPKLGEDISMNELHHCFHFILLCGNFLYPFLHIVYRKKDIQFVK